MSTEDQQLTVQWCGETFETYEGDENAVTVRLWDYDTCIAEYSRDGDGTWTLSGSDVCMLADDDMADRTYTDPRAALVDATAWTTRDSAGTGGAVGNVVSRGAW